MQGMSYLHTSPVHHQCICVYKLVLLFLCRACPIYTRVQFTINVSLCICLCYCFMQGMSYLHTSPVSHQCICVYKLVLLFLCRACPIYTRVQFTTMVDWLQPSMYLCVYVGVTVFKQGMSYLHTSPVHHQCICVYMLVLLFLMQGMSYLLTSLVHHRCICVYMLVLLFLMQGMSYLHTSPVHHHGRLTTAINVSVCICWCYWFYAGHVLSTHESSSPSWSTDYSHQCICVYMFVLLVYAGHVLSTHESSSPSWSTDYSHQCICVYMFVLLVYAGHVLSTHESSSPSWSTDYSHQCICVYMLVLLFLCRACPIYTRVQFTTMVDWLQPSMYLCVYVGVTVFKQGMSYLHTSPVHHQCICVYMLVLLFLMQGMSYLLTSLVHHRCICVYMLVLLVYAGHVLSTLVQFTINVSVCICLCYWFMQGMSYLHTSPVHHHGRLTTAINVSVCICLCYWFMQGMSYLHTSPVHHHGRLTTAINVSVSICWCYCFYAGHVLSTHESSSPSWSTDYSHQCICVYMFVLLVLFRACPISTRVQFTIMVDWLQASMYLCVYVCVTGLFRACPISTRVQFTIMVDWL